MSASQTSVYFTDQVPRRAFLNTHRYRQWVHGTCRSLRPDHTDRRPISAPQLAKTDRPENRWPYPTRTPLDHDAAKPLGV